LFFFCIDLGHAAEQYPTRPVEIICPLAAGGSTDLTMRAVVAVAAQYLGQPLIPIIRSGAAGAIGTAFVAHARADGIPILIAGPSSTVIRPLVEKVSYKMEDLIPIGRLSASPWIIPVLSTSPWKTLKEFLDDAKKNPGKFKILSGGVYNHEHIFLGLLSQMAGIELIHVPTAGGGPALTMLLGGHVDISAFLPSVITPHIASGTVRPLP